MARRDVRAAMAAGAVTLLATKGLEGTSFADVLAVAAAPRGSTYHHFPGGKAELIGSAVDLAGTRAMEAMEPVRGQPASQVVRRFLGLWRHLLRATDLGAGCAVLAVTVAADDPELLDRAGAVFRSWREHLTSLLVDGGVAVERAGMLAAVVIAASEGGVALARAERDWRPFDLVAEFLIGQADGESAGPDAP